MLGQEVVACREEMHRSGREEWGGGGDSFATGRFISWHWQAKATPRLTRSVRSAFSKMDSERRSAAGNACVQLLDDLRLWWASVGSRGTTKKKNKTNKPPLHLTLTS